MNNQFNGHTDNELVKEFQDFDNLEALATLYQRYTAQIFGVCLKYLKNVTDAEDTSMELFSILMRRLKGKDIERFGPWLYTVVKNHCIEKLRSTQRKKVKKDKADFVYSSQVYHPDSEGKENEEERLRNCMEKLKAMQKACIHLFYFEKLNYDEISDRMNIKWNQVRSNIQNGRRNLRNCLDK